MKRANVLSVLLVLLFMASCLVFFSVSADPNNENAPTASSEQSVTDDTSHAEETTANEVATTTTTTATTTTTGTTKATTTTTKSTMANPQFNTAATTSTASQNNDAGVVTTTEPATKQTKATMKTEPPTEPTTMAKMVSDYSVKTRPYKWISMAVMIACVIALIVINVNYRNKNGQKPVKRNTYVPSASPRTQAKPKLDVNARFDSPKSNARHNSDLDKTAVVDLSKFNKKPKDDDFKPKAKNDDIFGENNNDDDLYI